MQGIALVVSGDRGTQLVFRYPPIDEFFINGSEHKEIKSDLGRLHPFSKSLQDNTSSNPLSVHSEIDFFGISPASTFAKLFRPKFSMCGQILELDIDDRKFISYPSRLPEESQHEITFFNIVFVIYSESTNLNIFKSIVTRLSKAVEHEQIQRGFLTENVQNILNIRDEISCTPNWPQSEVKNFELISSIIQESPLACQLKDICEGLAKYETAHILLNGWIDLHFTLESPEAYSRQPIRPYQTLLLTESRNSLLEMLPSDGSSLLRVLIDHANPHKSFQELIIETDIALLQLFRFAAHLVYWKKVNKYHNWLEILNIAKIIDTLTKHAIYVVSASTDLSNLSKMSEEFSNTFPSNSLPEMLSRFSLAKKLQKHLESLGQYAQHQLLQMVIWMLQHDLLVQLHTYIVFMPPSVSSRIDEEFVETPKSQDTPMQIAMRHQSPTDKTGSFFRHSYKSSSLLSINTSTFLSRLSDNSPMGNLFKRLCPYFFGKHHIEEIMWKESISRTEIHQLLNAYSEVLITYIHQ